MRKQPDMIKNKTDSSINKDAVSFVIKYKT